MKMQKRTIGLMALGALALGAGGLIARRRFTRATRIETAPPDLELDLDIATIELIEIPLEGRGLDELVAIVDDAFAPHEPK